MKREQVPPLDPLTYKDVNAIILRSLRDGTDPVEALNRYGLLVTPARSHRMAVAGLDRLLEALLGWSAPEMLRRRVKGVNAATPADMYEAFVSFVQEYAAMIKEKGL